MKQDEFDIKKLLSELDLDEKISLLSGSGWWHTRAIDRLNIPSVRLCDGPHGVRRQESKNDSRGVGISEKSVCFPTASLSACSFDTELLYELGEHLAKEAKAYGASVLLGPGVNIKRSPLCGRNFEYFSEDPLVSGEMAAAQIKGLEENGVLSCIKHFAANNQEYCRFVSDSKVDEKTLHEIYLEAFRIAISKASPACVMSSYNRLNGIYTSEHYELLEGILRGVWGYEGLVMSDWGAVNLRDDALNAGLDLEMPDSHNRGGQRIKKAFNEGKVTQETIDKSVTRLLNLIKRGKNIVANEAQSNRAEANEFAKRLAVNSMVLLKNDDILPLDSKSKVAFIGEFFEKPRFQGGGSSHINAETVTSVLDSLKAQSIPYSYQKGYSIEDYSSSISLSESAIKLAKKSDKVIFAIGLPDIDESEGYDREHLNLPAFMEELLKEIIKVNKNVVVVLFCGASVAMPFISDVRAILYAGLSGQAGGGAVVDILYNNVNPSGKLAETWANNIKDTPCYLTYGQKDADYIERSFVGYRYYNAKGIKPLFSFGAGIGYSKFVYSNLEFNKKTNSVSLDVENVGKYDGKETVMFFVQSKDTACPMLKLAAFKKVKIAASKKQKVTASLYEHSFSSFIDGQWQVMDGSYDVIAAPNAGELSLAKEVQIKARTKSTKFTLNSTLNEISSHPVGVHVTSLILGGLPKNESEGTNEMFKRMFMDLPLRALAFFAGDKFSEEALDEILRQLNS